MVKVTISLEPKVAKKVTTKLERMQPKLGLARTCSVAKCGLVKASLKDRWSCHHNSQLR